MSENPDSQPPLPKEEGSSDPFETYHTIAETVGGVPSFRKNDNLIQGLTILIGTLGSIALGYFVWDRKSWLLAGLARMIGSLLISGVVPMVLGWMRAAKK